MGCTSICKPKIEQPPVDTEAAWHKPKFGTKLLQYILTCLSIRLLWTVKYIY